MSDDDPNIPPRLADDLADLYDARLFIPPSVDRTILDAARAQLAPAQRASADRTNRLRLFTRAAAVAAGLLIAALLVVRYPDLIKTPKPQSLPGITASADVDRSGSVDIVDAFLLARIIETDGTRGVLYDVNGDGSVDRADVDDIARRAVALNLPGGAG